MLTLSPRHQLLIGLILALLMALTRGGHFATLDPLPESSWAVFLLAGIYLRPFWVLIALMAEAVLLDWSAIALNGVSAFCVSAAYVALAPAYAVLWGAGRGYARVYRPSLSTLLPLAAATLGSALLCELISSGSFYFFSGRFPEPSLAAFLPRLLHYGPNNIATFAVYTAVAAALHVIVVGLRHRAEAGSTR